MADPLIDLFRERYTVSSPVILGELLSVLRAAIEQFGDLECWAVYCAVLQRSLRAKAGADATAEALISGDVPMEGRGSNVASIAAYLGIPRETVRRKVNRLLERDWVERRGRLLFATPRALSDQERLREQIFASVARITELAGQIRVDSEGRNR